MSLVWAGDIAGNAMAERAPTRALPDTLRSRLLVYRVARRRKAFALNGGHEVERIGSRVIAIEVGFERRHA